jgi:DNA-binding transcriptional regulator LsrR (DeoR family)
MDSAHPEHDGRPGQLEGVDDLLQVADLFYLQAVSQKQIADRLGVHPSTVSRLLAEARSRGLVHFTLCPPLDLDLARQLREHLDGSTVREALVSPPGRTAVAMSAARYFEQVVGRSNMTIVLDGGFTVRDFVDGLKPGLYQRVTIAPIASDPPSYDVGAYELMTRLSIKYPVHVCCLKPPLRLDPVLQADHEAVRRAAADADVVVLGAGPLLPRFSALEFMRHLGLDLDHIRSAYTRIACLSGYYPMDEHGRPVRMPELEDRLPRTLRFDDLKAMAGGGRCRSILMAAGAEKARAVAGVIEAGLCNTLLADRDLALELLHLPVRQVAD